MLMKRSIFAFLLSLVLALLPLGHFAEAYDERVDINLNNYHGDALDLPEEYQYTILLSGDNVIDTSGEFGIRVAARDLIFRNADPTAPASLTINVNSATSTANGILNTLGDVTFYHDLTINLNIRSALDPAETSTANVTGITTTLEHQVYSTARTYLNIDNPTGNFGIYSGGFSASQYVNGEFLGYQAFTYITHKITDGYGDALFYNDIEGSTMSERIPQRISVTQPNFTFSHLKTDTLGVFRLLPAAYGYSANFEQELTEGEELATAEARLLASLGKELAPETITDIECIVAPFCPYNPNLFEIDKSKSGLEVISNTSLLRSASSSTVSADNSYNLKITFTISDPDHFAFSRLDGFGPFSQGILNGKETYLDTAMPSRVYVSPTEIYVLAPLTVISNNSTIEVEEEVEEEVEIEIEIEIETEPTPVTLPKAPNTGRK